ncbi:MAG: hypothetical protein U0804_17235 [Gemmataceae bacterium]|uniref:Uncharacterized protein n=1 Tax=Urbifossiella limnaea TaxID=2528023 RepID=A0A517XXJ6_9BACT|nr:hypothetical protein [Urbifossiella limnaea]QDU22238.1 hypothetical protein ETAA1_42150 [Urbifossiella limnaea]
MFRRLAALTVLAFSLGIVSYAGMATGQEKEKPKSKSTTKGTAKGTKKGKAPEKTEKSE